jgi:hypothetical protein
MMIYTQSEQLQSDMPLERLENEAWWGFKDPMRRGVLKRARLPGQAERRK